MKKEIRIFFTSLMFFTRIPCPHFTDHSQEYLDKSTRYVSLVGIVVGSISFTAFLLASHLFNPVISVLFSLIAGILTTGAFHEDGFADVFDGFGGGWTKERILEIMKDSRLGTYGTVSLIFLFALKIFALLNIVQHLQGNLFLLFLIFISYHSIARISGITIFFTTEYSRADESGKTKPIVRNNTWKEVAIVYGIGLIPFLLLTAQHIYFTLIIFPLVILHFYSRYYFKKWIGGYTGDCLGAVEQFSELFLLLSITALCKYL